jgi:F-type H+-transporting ATPase subunit delta
MAGSRETTAARYARAAFEIAVEDGTLDRWRQDLASIASLFGETDVERVMDDNRVPEDQKMRVVDAALPTLTPQGRNLAQLLIQKRRTGIAGLIDRQFQGLADEHEGLARGVLTTAVELTPDQRAEVQAKLSELTGKRVLLETRVDPSILGGMIARVGDRLLDGSTRTRLEQLRARLQGVR